jgi:hypothetical protein
MAKRYYLVPIVETEGEIGPVFSPKVPAGVNFAAEIKTGEDGRPVVPWALVLVSASNHLPLLSDPEIHALPDFPKDAKVGAMHQATKLAMRAGLIARGLNASIADNADGFRDVLRGIGRHLNPTFHEDNFDVAE